MSSQKLIKRSVDIEQRQYRWIKKKRYVFSELVRQAIDALKRGDWKYETRTRPKRNQ